MRSLLLDLLPLLAPLPIIVVGVYAYLRTRQRWLIWLGVGALAAPLPVISLYAAYAYFAGIAPLAEVSTGYHSLREKPNLDPTYRAFPELRRPSNFWAYQARALERRVARALFSRFGPMRGSYLGPYPSRASALEATLTARVFIALDSLESPIAIDGRALHLPAEAVQRVTDWFGRSRRDISDRPLSVALVDGTCLVVGFWPDTYYHLELIDTSGFGWFARYVFQAEERGLPPRR